MLYIFFVNFSFGGRFASSVEVPVVLDAVGLDATSPQEVSVPKKKEF